MHKSVTFCRPDLYMKQIDEGSSAASSGRPWAFADLVDAYKGPVFSLAFRMTGSTQDADDLTQESFLRAFQSLGRFEGGAAILPLALHGEP